MTTVTNRYDETNQEQNKSVGSSKKYRIITNANTDHECCLPNNANLFQRVFYKIEIHTGIKSLHHWYERCLCHFIIWTSLIVSFLVIYIFVSGTFHGIQTKLYTEYNNACTGFNGVLPLTNHAQLNRVQSPSVESQEVKDGTYMHISSSFTSCDAGNGGSMSGSSSSCESNIPDATS